ncbi:MAG: ABC transporter ATP-binding protein [Beijerinckiaceae bacterium]|nr:ABC transporter ATP-binding protein [Beijerinckiaceae bacterium]
MTGSSTRTSAAGSLDPVLEIRDLSVALPAWADRRLAVNAVSLTVGRGETLCVVGESGSGKSVMARSILRLLPEPHLRIAGGQILLDGEDLARADDRRMRQIRGGEISMVFQEPMVSLNPLMTVGRQIDEILEVHTGWSKAERRRRVIATFEDVRLPEPELIVGAYPHELSGGQRQRVMIAMSLVLEPKLIIADEPTTALDVTTEAQVLTLLKELQVKHGTALLFITHNFGVVAEIADRVAVMRSGELVEYGSAKDVLEHPQHPYTRALIDAVPSLVPRKHPEPSSTAEPILTVRALEKTYGRPSAGPKWLARMMPRLARGRRSAVKAVNKVDLDIRRGSAVALVGESGSGKSTLARCLIGLEQADSGSALIAGDEIVGRSRADWRPLRSRVQMVFQDPFASLNPRTKVGDIIARGAILQGVNPAAAMEQARRLLDLVGLDAKAAERFPHEFSGGQRQRIGIARALAVKPDILIADEPVSALDVSVQKQVLDLLDDLRRQFGLTMLFITHDLRVAAHVCEDIVVLKNGTIVERGLTADIFANPQHDYTRTLLASVPGRDWQRRGLPDQMAPTGE